MLNDLLDRCRHGIGSAAMPGRRGVIAVEAQLVGAVGAAVAEGGPEVEVMEAELFGEPLQPGMLPRMLAVVELRQIGEDREKHLEPLPPGELRELAQRRLDRVSRAGGLDLLPPGLQYRIAHEAVERAVDEQPLGRAERQDPPSRRRFPERLHDPRVRRAAVVVAVGHEDQVGREGEGPSPQRLHLLLRVVAGDAEIEHLDRQPCPAQILLQKNRKGILGPLDPVPLGDAVAEHHDAVGPRRLGQRVIAVAVAEAVARPRILEEAVGRVFLVHQAGDRLEDQPRIGRELEAAAADRRHLGSPDDPQQDLPSRQGEEDAEAGGGELLLHGWTQHVGAAFELIPANSAAGGGYANGSWRRRTEMSSSFGLYLIGFIILIIGLALGARLAGMPTTWIAVGVICLLGIGILSAVKKTQTGTRTGTGTGTGAGARPGGNPPRY